MHEGLKSITRALKPITRLFSLATKPSGKVIWQKYFPNVYLKSLSFDYNITLQRETGKGSNGQTGNHLLRKGDAVLLFGHQTDILWNKNSWSKLTITWIMNQYFKWPQTSLWSRKNLYYNFKYLHEVDTKQTTMWKKN